MADTKVGLRVSDCIKTRYTASFIDKVHALCAFCMLLLISSLVLTLKKIDKSLVDYSVSARCWIITCEIPIS